MVYPALTVSLTVTRITLKEIMATEEFERDFKTTSEHWDVIINYPMLLKSKFGGFDGDNIKIKELWEEMIGILNSLGHGQRSIQKWKEAIGRWKSKVKAKARRQRQEMTATGGGSMKTIPLTQTEEKLMAILGWKAVTGDLNKELGIVDSNTTINNKVTTERSTNNKIITSTPSKVISSTSVQPFIRTNTEMIIPESIAWQSGTKEMTQSASTSTSTKEMTQYNIVENKNKKIFQEAKTVSSPIQTVLSTASKSSGIIEPPPLVLLKKGTANGDKEKPSVSTSNKRTVNEDKENFSLQNKKRIITSSDKSQRYVTLTTMHREQTDILNNINLNIQNASYHLEQIASNINQLVNYYITNEKTDNEFESVEFLDDNYNMTE
ncbi:uncharacterized protein LOC118645492 isoform X2 [Monomorium pharaonis]|uniref:uncharacterized protein LOC118645260 isoform X2 n=1 Tax=Monomorium pharaonis TaxID=307658 RepID=UPI0017464E2A|nr:uncharacterized protein LOC118645260 isoform X2 [Monomorium pharaonis]XP_036141978.1 uncharacterized protein LOC118645282 isoform X2 [Monomorium pharaonis]XP_036142567.1 uncharacterized protein LOC118645492 isoform X2 [Monomorium pharaonis]